MDIKKLTPEEKLLILEEGLRSPFWEYLHANYKQLYDTTAGAAISHGVTGRDWQAGEASGLKRALELPVKQFLAIKKIQQQKIEASIPDTTRTRR